MYNNIIYIIYICTLYIYIKTVYKFVYVCMYVHIYTPTIYNLKKYFYIYI